MDARVEHGHDEADVLCENVAMLCLGLNAALRDHPIVFGPHAAPAVVRDLTPFVIVGLDPRVHA